MLQESYGIAQCELALLRLMHTNVGCPSLAVSYAQDCALSSNIVSSAKLDPTGKTILERKVAFK